MRKEHINVLERIIRIGLFLLPPMALIVGGNIYGKILLPWVGDLFFPFITAKNFYFRIIVEVIFSLWAIVALFDARFRPRMTPLMWAIFATVGVLTLSTIFGENPYRSFWSNYERMEGLVGHLHLLAFFIVITSMFKEVFDWKKFFFISLGSSFLVASYAYCQSLGIIRIFQSGDRLDATLGNATYLAIYIVFHLFIALYFLLQENKQWLRYVLGALILFELPVVFLTATRGAVLGLIGGILLLALFYIFWNPNRTYKKIALSAIGIIVVLVGVFWAIRETSFVRHNYILQRFANFSFSEQTIKSRFTIWGMSFKGFKEQPILGWGLENYSIVFNKYYEPELWPQETWFDRAHNVIFDWLPAGGSLGLVAFLSIFISALYMMFKTRDRPIAMVFCSLFAVYFFHNLTVFDNLVSYFMFFSVLGLIHSSYSSAYPASAKTSSYPINFSYSLSALVIILFPIFFYFVNVKPMLASTSLISALKDIGLKGGQTDLILSDFDKVFSYKTFGTPEAREQLITYSTSVLNSQLPDADKEKVLVRAISEMQKQVAEQPKEARGHLFLTTLYSNAGRFEKALESGQKALDLSPRKQSILFTIANVYLKKGDTKSARGSLEKAYNLDPSFSDAAKNFAMILILDKEITLAEKVLEATFGTKLPQERQIWSAYAEIGNFAKARDILLVIVKKDPANIQAHTSLAAMYLNLGERTKAVQEIQKAIESNPEFKQQGEYFINEIRAGRNP